MIIENKIKFLKGEAPIYDESYGRKSFKAEAQAEIIKGCVEIIKNGADAYLEEKKGILEKCHNEKINVYINSIKKTISVTNFAEGMPLTIFQTALKVGGDTGSTAENKTGAHGYGMKEAAWAFENTTITSIYNGRYSTRIFWWDEEGNPKYDWDIDDNEKEIKDVPVNKAIKEKTGILDEGTFFEGKVPDNIPFPNFDSLWRMLNDNVLLRKINQYEGFEINVQYLDRTKRTFGRILKYEPPEKLTGENQTDSQMSGKFSFEYPGYGRINCSYDIFLAKHELPSMGDTREAGLLICHGPISVLDCTLFNQGGKIANRFFGEVTLEGPLRMISKKQRIIDDRRVAGLIKNSPLYQNLEKNMGTVLEKLIERERKRLSKTYRGVQSGVLENESKLLKALNKMAKDIETEETDIRGDDKFDPGEEGIRFCIQEDSYLEILEHDSKNLHIAVDPSKISKESEIIIKSNNPSIKISPTRFFVSSMEKVDNQSERLKKKIKFEPTSIGEYQITAYVAGLPLQAKLDVAVIEDERLKIEAPIGFLPKGQDIVTKKKKSFCLIADFSKIKESSKPEFAPDSLFKIEKVKKKRRIKGKIFGFEFEVFCVGRPNQRGKIKASLEEFETQLDLNIINPRDKHLKGPFEKLKDDIEEDPSELGAYIENEKTISIFVKHPILKHYRPEKGPYYRAIYADIIVREACKALARKRLKPFLNTPAEEYRPKFDKKFNEYYKKNSPSLHRFCINPENIEILKRESR